MALPVKEYYHDHTTGQVTIEYSDDSTKSFNMNDVVTAETNPVTGGIEISAVGVQLPVTNSGDVGYDIVLCAGQSNMAGRATIESSVDYIDNRVQQFGCYTSDENTYLKIVAMTEPLKGADSTLAGGKTGPAPWFGRAYSAGISGSRRVLLVSVAVGGTSLVGGTPTWNAGTPGGSNYENAIAKANAAIAAARRIYPSSRFVGTIWIQGETDGDNAVSQSAYAAALKSMISGFRSRIAGAKDSWFVIGGLVPEAIDTRSGYDVIDLAHKQVAQETENCVFADGIAGNSSDDLHYTAATGARAVGQRLAAAALGVSDLRSQVVSYDFENDDVGAYPDGVVTHVGGLVVADGSTVGISGNCIRSTSTSSSVTDSHEFVDMVPTKADQTVTWRRAQTSKNARDGFVLRPQGGVIAQGYSCSPGYLFQTSASNDQLLIYKLQVGASAAGIGGVSLVVGDYTFYRASVIGDSLTFEYSVDGESWTTGISVTDATFVDSTGCIQYLNGFSKTGQASAFIADVSLS